MPDEADVDAEAPMRGGAVDAEEDPVRDRCPRRVLRIAVEAHLKMEIKSENRQIRERKLYVDLELGADPVDEGGGGETHLPSEEAMSVELRRGKGR
ncbi:hypothetical protein ACLOJK_030529 [Asimina triloba]